MTRPNNLDTALDGYDPEDAYVRRKPDPERSRGRKSAEDKADKERPRRRTGQQRPGIVRLFTDERMRIFLGSALILLSVFLIYAIISYFRYGDIDQSQVMNVSASEMAASPGSVKNGAGPIGAILAQWLMCDTFGIGSIVFVAYLWILALGLLGIKKCNFWSATFKTLLMVISLSIVTGLLTYNSGSRIYWGGNHGHYVNKFLIDNATYLGAILVSILLVTAVACVYLNELRRAWRMWRETVNRARIQNELRARRLRDLDNVMDDEDAPEPADNQDSQPEDDNPDNTPQQPIALDDDFANQSADDKPDTPFQPESHSEGGNENSEFSIVTNEIEKADKIVTTQPVVADGMYDHRADLSHFNMPRLDLLEDRPCGKTVDPAELEENKDRIVKTLLDYKIPISKITASVGPTVTLYEIVPAEGVRIAQIKRLEDDIALSLSALGIRIIAPIPGKGTVGIEVPNRVAQPVSMYSIIASKKYQETKMELPMCMGTTISNDVFIADLASMPHILVAGATGMGKSVGLNAIIASLLYKKHPSELKLVMIDPKMVEFSQYGKIEQHYLAKLPGEEEAIITDMAKVIATLNSLCIEMDNRYALLRKAGVVKITDYNDLFTHRKLNPNDGHEYMPYIVVVIDEFADLIMTAGKEVEAPIIRIVQKARAVGIHMIIATQRPSTNVLTGVIKANCPGRIAFRVQQMVDSRTILDCPGANQLIGKGDMLFSQNGAMQRVQCAFISTSEIKAITEFIAGQMGYEHAYYLPEYVPDNSGDVMGGTAMERDSLFDEAARFVVGRNQGSTSSLQRQFGIGYNRAGKLMDQMEAAGIVGPVCGSKPRAILIDSMTLERILENK